MWVCLWVVVKAAMKVGKLDMCLVDVRVDLMAFVKAGKLVEL